MRDQTLANIPGALLRNVFQPDVSLLVKTAQIFYEQHKDIASCQALINGWQDYGQSHPAQWLSQQDNTEFFIRLAAAVDAKNIAAIDQIPAPGFSLALHNAVDTGALDQFAIGVVAAIASGHKKLIAAIAPEYITTFFDHAVNDEWVRAYALVLVAVGDGQQPVLIKAIPARSLQKILQQQTREAGFNVDGMSAFQKEMHTQQGRAFAAIRETAQRYKHLNKIMVAYDVTQAAIVAHRGPARQQ